MGGFELWAWLFMRISGIVLLLLAVGHTLIMHLPGGGVDRVDFGFVAERWASPFWRTWDWMMLTLALIHGINGLRNITLDYVRQPGVRFALNMAYYVLGFTLLILGTVIVVTFDPDEVGMRGTEVMATTHTYDALVVGRRRRRACAPRSSSATQVRTAVVSKLYPTRSHTGAAQGGVCAALGNTEEDHPEWHAFDTVKGGDYLTDQPAAQLMTEEAVDAIYQLERWGLPFNRTPEGTHRSAPVRRPHREPRRAAGAARVLRRRPHRPHDPADALSAVREARRSLLQRVLLPRPAARRRRRHRGHRRLRARDRRAARLPCEVASCSPPAATDACSASPRTRTR